MVTLEMVENGLGRYLDNELLPKLPRDGIKGFGIGVAATLLVKRGGALLRGLAENKTMQLMGLIGADGAVDLDAVQEAAMANIPPTGVTIDLPIGVQLRLHREDAKCICDYIRGVR